MSLLLRQFLYILYTVKSVAPAACKLRQRQITDILGMSDSCLHSTGMTDNGDTMLLRMIEISCFELFRTTSFTIRHIQVGTLSDTCYWYITSCRYTTGVYRASFMFIALEYYLVHITIVRGVLAQLRYGDWLGSITPLCIDQVLRSIVPLWYGPCPISPTTFVRHPSVPVLFLKRKKRKVLYWKLVFNGMQHTIS